MCRAAYPLVLLGCLAVSCDTVPEFPRYPIRGRIISVDSERRTVTLEHEAVPGYMDAMTMPFRIGDEENLADRSPGDLISAVLVISAEDALLTQLVKTGVEALPTKTSIPTPDLLAPGSNAPDQQFIDQDGRPRLLSASRGRAVAMTFIYTSCPLPTFCPLMDRHFATIQRAVARETQLTGQVDLLSVSFDPDRDTPAVLKRHAERLEADPSIWTFLTAPRDEIDRFAARFGVAVSRPDDNPGDISHTLRTVVLDRTGRIVKLYVGFDWTPTQVLRDLRGIVGGS